MKTLSLVVGLLGIGMFVGCRKAFPVPDPKTGAIFITGASSGIGKDAALALDTLGFTVFAGVRKTLDAEKLKKERPTLRPVIVDVVDEAQCIAAAVSVAAELEKDGLKLVGLVNNAGISWRLPLELESMAEVRAMYEVNVFGLMQSSQAFIPMLRDGGAGARIVNVGSVAGLLEHKGASAYGGTKAALEMISNVMRLELMEWGISVSLLEPAYVKTEIAKKQVGSNAKWKTADPEKLPFYKEWAEKQDAKRNAVDKHSASVQVTSDAIVHAITSQYPQTRYVVASVGKGIPAWIVTFLAWLLPDRLVDMAAVHF